MYCTAVTSGFKAKRQTTNVTCNSTKACTKPTDVGFLPPYNPNETKLDRQ